jgi:N-acetylneuraminic acid mutarotase
MKTSEVRTVPAYRTLFVVLAALLLTLPANAAWKNKKAMPSGRYSAAVETINGIIYVAGGNNGSGDTSTLQALNPETNTWTTLASMPGGRYDGDGAGVINSQLYVAGGWTTASGLPQNSLYMYDPPSNSWAALPTMPQLSGCGATGVINSKLYVTTPCNGFSGYYNILDVFDPVTGVWTSLPNSSSAHANPAFGVINGKFYVAGGQDASFAYTTVLEVYDPEANTWTTLAPMPTGVINPASVALNGRLYVFGGNNGANVTTVQEYNPYTNAWQTLSSSALPKALADSSGVVVYGIPFVEGGYTSRTTTTNEYLIITPSIP